MVSSSDYQDHDVKDFAASSLQCDFGAEEFNNRKLARCLKQKYATERLPV